MGREGTHERSPRDDDLRTRLSELRVPDVERPQVRTGPTAPHRRTGRLQQRGPLAQHPLVVRDDAGDPGCQLHEEVVEESATPVRVALHEREVLGREEHRAQDPEDVPRPRRRTAVDPRAVRLARRHLDLDQRGPGVAGVELADDASPHDRPRRPGPDQRRIRRDAVAAQRRDVPERLDEIRLALPVGSDQRGDARVERELDLRVRAEVGQREVRDVHACPVRRTAARPRPWRAWCW